MFHLLAAGDLQAVKRANAHFSDDLLSGLLNEPLPGNGVFWSSVEGKSYPLPIRALSFEDAFKVKDRDRRFPAAKTFAADLRRRFDDLLKESQEKSPRIAVHDADGHEQPGRTVSGPPVMETDAGPDAMDAHVQAAIRAFCGNGRVIRQVREVGLTWRGVMQVLLESLPPQLDGVDRLAFDTVPRALDTAFGKGNWSTEKRPRRQGLGAPVTWVVVRESSTQAPETVVKEAPDESDEIPF